MPAGGSGSPNSTTTAFCVSTMPPPSPTEPPPTPCSASLISPHRHRARPPQTLSSPGVLITDAAGALYVSDYGNGRVLIYKNAAAKANGAAADIVIGQPDMTTNTVGITDRILSTPFGGLAFDAAGSLWISSYASYRVLAFLPRPPRGRLPPRAAKVPKSTSSSKVTLKGTATDPSGVASVRFRCRQGSLQKRSRHDLVEAHRQAQCLAKTPLRS
jgi:sugar lactone lactonase YvrE